MKDTSTIRPASAISRAVSIDAPDVLDPVGIGEAQVAVEAVAHVVAVQQVGVAAERGQAPFDAVGDRRLARARQAGEPQDGRTMSLDRRARRLVDGEVLPGEVGGTSQRKADHAGADRGVGQPVDQDEAAGLAVVVVGVEGQGAVERQVGRSRCRSARAAWRPGAIRCRRRAGASARSPSPSPWRCRAAAGRAGPAASAPRPATPGARRTGR